MPRACVLSCFSLTLAVYLTGAAPAAQAASGAITAQDGHSALELRLDTPSGLPVPRLVSLKSETTFCRAGPSFSHPVRLTFMRQGLPVLTKRNLSWAGQRPRVNSGARRINSRLRKTLQV